MKQSINKMETMIFGILTLVFLITPYFRGLYFDTDLYWVELTIYIVFLIFIFSVFRGKSFDSTIKQSIKPWIVMLIPLIYTVSYFQAASPFFAVQGIMRFYSYSIIFIIFSHLFSKSIKINDILQFTILLTALWVTLLTWFNLWGLIDFKDAVLSNRFSSVFQYPNTYGIYLIAVFLASTMITIKDNLYWSVFGSSLLFMFFSSLLLTLSRGALVILPIATLIVISSLPVKKQVQYLLSMVAPILLSFLYFDELQLVLQSSEVIYIGFQFLLIGTFVTSIINTAIFYLFKKVNWQKNYTITWFQLILPAILIIGSIVFIKLIIVDQYFLNSVPDVLSERIKSINIENESANTRFIYNQDSLEIFNEYSILGAGGGAWKALFQKYQSYNYWSTQSHNFYTQLAVEVGIIGIGIFILVFLIIIISFIKSYLNGNHESRMRQVFWFSIFVPILLHSFIDFNLTFGYIAFLMFLSLAGIYQVFNDQKKDTVHQKKTAFKRKQNIIVSVLLWTSVIASLAVILFNIRFIVAHNHYSSLRNSNNMTAEEIYKTVEKSVSNNPLNPDYLVTYWGLLLNKGINEKNQQLMAKSEELVNEAIELEPQNPKLLHKAAVYKANIGKWKESLYLLEKAIENGRWNMELYEQYFIYSNHFINVLLNSQNFDEILITINKAEAYYTQILNQTEYMNALPTNLLDKQPFAVTDIIRIESSKHLVIINQLQEAITRLTPILSTNADPQTKNEAAKWLIIANERLGNKAEAQRLQSEILQNNPEYLGQLELLRNLPIIEKEE